VIRMPEVRMNEISEVKDDPGVLLRGILYFRSVSMKNTRRVVWVGKKGQKKRPMVIKSEEALDFEDRVRVAVLASELPSCPIAGATSMGTISHGYSKLCLHATVYQPDMRRDVDVELLADCLQKFGVVTNDRAFWRKTADRELDKDHPRIEFTVGIRNGHEGCK